MATFSLTTNSVTFAVTPTETSFNVQVGENTYLAVAEADRARTEADRAEGYASAIGGVLALDSSGAVDNLVAALTVGRAIDPVTGSAANGTYVFNDPATETGYLKSIRVFGVGGGGTFQFKRFSKSGNTFTQIGSDYPVTIVAGLNNLTDADYGIIPINAGEYLGFFGNGRVSYKTSTTADGTGWRQVGAGNVTSGTVTTVNTSTRLEIGFDVGYSAFESTLPGRVDVAEGFALPFKPGAVALSEIPGAITVFDARDSKDIAGGRVREWKSQDRRLTARQEDLTTRPVFSTTGPYIDFGTAGGMLAYPDIKYRDKRHMPDSTVSPYANPPGGFVCTGMALRPDRKLVIANDGRISSSSSTWTGSNGASLFVLDEGTLAVRDEFSLRTAVSGGFLESAQGVGVTYDGSKYYYWVADTQAGKVRCLRDEKNGTLLHISANDITPNAAFTPNGVSCDRTADELYVSSAPGVVEVWDISGTPAFSRTFTAHDDIDQLCVVYPETRAAGLSTTSYASEPYLFCTSGGNGEYPDIFVYTNTGKLVTVYHNIIGPQSVEGIVVDYKTGTIMLAHDGNYHLQGDDDAALLAIYDADLPPEGVCPDRVLIGMVAKLKTSSNTAFFGLEDATSGLVGWGLRRNGASTLQIATSERTASITATTPATLTSWFYVTLDIQANGTIAARVNGASSAVTGSLAGYDYGLSCGALVIGAERTANGALALTGNKEIAAIFHGSLDDIDGDAGAISARIAALEAAMLANYPDLIT